MFLGERKKPAVCARRIDAWRRTFADAIRQPISVAVAAAAISLLVWASPASSESLNSALSAAYDTNPQLGAERARLRAIDENLPLAKSGYRPRVTATGDIQYQRTDSDPSQVTDGVTHPKGYAVQLSQSLFDGYQTRNAISVAEANIQAGRENLRTAEQQILLQAVAAYMNVIRDRAIVRLRENNVRVLSRDLRATQDRFDVGEVTRTDVAQAQARRAASVSALDLARANLRASSADFERVVGHAPGSLHEPSPAHHLLPRSLNEALQIGQGEHPTIVGAVYLERAAQFTVDQINGQLLPQVDLNASYQKRFDQNSRVFSTETTNVTVQATVPLYTGGGVAAQVRQAKESRIGRLGDIEQARVQVRSDVTAAWSQLMAARAQIESDRIQVSASQTALTGVREEERVGQRTLLDVLDAEQELLNAQVQLVGTQRDLVVAAYSVLSSIGRLSVSNLGLGVAQYDAEQHTREVEDLWWGTTISREPEYEHFWWTESGSTKDGG